MVACETQTHFIVIGMLLQHCDDVLHFDLQKKKLILKINGTFWNFILTIIFLNENAWLNLSLIPKNRNKVLSEKNG